MRSTAVRVTVIFLFSITVLSFPTTSPAAGEAATSKTPTTGPTTSNADEPGPSKFYGTISAVDTKANTFTIDGQTYSVVADSHMTKAADGSAASLTDATVGETARGTYTKSSDGKLSVTKVRFGKKTGGSGGGAKSRKSATQKSE